ncbi:MAG TPA: ATPase, partial [Deltaproteobacteria bacterium]|nr:ATPase [Deltaproteobacteria bacterium]
VGKTTLLQEVLPVENTFWINLLDFEVESRFLQRPQAFRETLDTLPPQMEWVVIDEVQKLPFLLDEVHHQIERNKNRCFALTGSSARKLKRGQANLLAGRAFSKILYPLTMNELGNRFDLQAALEFGTLPGIFSFESPEMKKEFLRSYAQMYLQEEIQMEGLVRNLLSFRKFLPLAAAGNGEVLSWTSFAQDVGNIDAKTVRSYFEILEDTLVGFLLPAYSRSLRKRQRTHPKFYFFDTGVKRALANQLNLPLLPGTPEYGRAFEHFWILEMMRMNAYRSLDFSFSYFGTHDVEVDLVVERPGKPLLFVEIKASEFVKESGLRSLKALAEEVKDSEAVCISRDLRKRKVGPVLICPWQEALSVLGMDELEAAQLDKISKESRIF